MVEFGAYFNLKHVMVVLLFTCKLQPSLAWIANFESWVGLFLYRLV